LNTDFLNGFLAVARHGSMAEAARRLNLSPAAVAQQVRALERELGAPLLARSGRTVVPTEAGQRIVERARAILRDLEDLRGVATEEGLSGELRLGAGTNALLGIVPPVLQVLVSRYPAMKVFIRPSISVELYPAVESGELDAAVVLQPPAPGSKTVGWALLREEPLVLLAPAHLAACDPHELLSTQPLIRFDRRQWSGEMADRYLRRARIEPRERCEINLLSAIAVMVDCGLGVSLVPRWIRPWPEGLNLACLPLPLPSPGRRVGVIWSKSSVRSRLAIAFRDEAIRQFRSGREVRATAAR